MSRKLWTELYKKRKKGDSITEAKPKRKKFNNKIVNGYDSTKEYRRSIDLKLMEKAGVITDLVEQGPKYILIPKQKGERATTYTPDFTYYEDGEFVVEDVKSDITRKQQSYVKSRKLMLHVHGIRIRET